MASDGATDADRMDAVSDRRRSLRGSRDRARLGVRAPLVVAPVCR